MGDTTPIDWNKAISQLGGSKLLGQFVERFEKDTLKASIKAVQTSMKARDWPVVKREAHSLKGASGYIAATTCHKLAESLQYAAQEEPIDEVKINQCYNALADHARILQEYLSTHLKKEFEDPEDVFSYRAGHLAQVKEEHSQEDSIMSSDQRVTSSDGSTTYVIRRVTPPFTKVYQSDDDFEMLDDDMPDAYEELNRQWKCLLI